MCPRNPRSIRLYRRCLRCCRLMEPAMAEYYRGFAYEHIMSHFQEIDPVRTEYLQGKGEEVLQWVLRKYELEEPIRQVDLLDGSKAADDANVLPTAATGAPGMGGVFQTEERDDGLGCKGADKVWMPPGTAGKPMVWSTPSPKLAVGGKEVESKVAWRPQGR